MNAMSVRFLTRKSSHTSDEKLPVNISLVNISKMKKVVIFYIRNPGDFVLKIDPDIDVHISTLNLI